MDQLDARELINNGWLALVVSIVVILVPFLIRQMREDGWYGRRGNQAALALVVYFTGEALARGWGALLLYKMQHGQDLLGVFAVEQKYPVAMAGAALSFIGAICCVRVFSSGKAWIVVAALTVAVMIATYYAS